jgi:uncharacterized protein YndB with AHSA1/START domain
MFDDDKPHSEAEIFRIDRVFDAPRDLVWAACTEAQHLAAWFGPPGTTVKVKTLDLKPGGLFHYGMEMPGGIVMWGKWMFRAVEAPSKLSYVVSFCTETGEPVRHPMAPLWPLEVLAVQSFVEQGGKTLMHSESWPINATAEERAVFTAGHASMQMGFSGAYAQLDAYLARIKTA